MIGNLIHGYSDMSLRRGKVMSGTSSTTVPVNFRIPVELYDIIQKRLAKRPGKWANVNVYIKQRVIFDAQRKH